MQLLFSDLSPQIECKIPDKEPLFPVYHCVSKTSSPCLLNCSINTCKVSKRINEETNLLSDFYRAISVLVSTNDVSLGNMVPRLGA